MKDATPAPPDLSVVLVCPTGRRTLHRTLASIAAQTIAGRIEVIIVAPNDDFAGAEGRLLARLHSVRVIIQDPIPNVDHAAARALVAGRAAIVASIEDHAYPDHDWAERMLAAFDGDCVAVGSAMLNANPGSALSWSNMLIAYWQWTEATPPGEIGWVALHNCSYRRDALLPFAAELEELFNREGDILLRLKAQRGTFRFAPDALIRHLNPSNLRSTARLRFDAGCLAAANRARDEGWSLARRLAYGLLGPLIPFVRYRKMRRDIFGRIPHVTERKHGWPLFIGLVFDGAGQIAGFLRGPGGARDRLAVFEMDRLEHLNASDRAAFEPFGPA